MFQDQSFKMSLTLLSLLLFSFSSYAGTPSIEVETSPYPCTDLKAWKVQFEDNHGVDYVVNRTVEELGNPLDYAKTNNKLKINSDLSHFERIGRACHHSYWYYPLALTLSGDLLEFYDKTGKLLFRISAPDLTPDLVDYQIESRSCGNGADVIWPSFSEFGRTCQEASTKVDRKCIQNGYQRCWSCGCN